MGIICIAFSEGRLREEIGPNTGTIQRGAREERNGRTDKRVEAVFYEIIPASSSGMDEANTGRETEG